MAATTSKRKTTTKKAGPKKAKKPATRKAAAKKAPAKKAQAKKAAPRAADRADKSVEEFRDALERSVTLSRERIQEIVD
ncbi:MAG: hypothetical protein WBB30_09450, partial [Solirubrobacterales bacterium]